MDPFSSFDLFRRRVDQMFSEFDQQMFGSMSEPFDTLQPSQQQQQQQQQIAHDDKSDRHVEQDKDEQVNERVVPLSKSRSPTDTTTTNNNNNNNVNTTRTLATRPFSSSPFPSSSLFHWPGSSSWLSHANNNSSISSSNSSMGFGLLPSMKLDVIEEKDQYLIHADVPGFTKDELNLDVHDGVLTVKGETSHKQEVSDVDRKYHRVERSSGSLYRSLRLPAGVREDDITATCENGVLKIQVPKREDVETKEKRRIQVD